MVLFWNVVSYGDVVYYNVIILEIQKVLAVFILGFDETYSRGVQNQYTYRSYPEETAITMPSRRYNKEYNEGTN